MSTEAEKTYELTLSRGRVTRITIPANYKVTYGPAIGPAGKAAYGSGMCFRVWESANLQRGLWSDVESFRDVSIPVQVKAVRYFGTSDDNDWFLDDGSFVGAKALLVEKGWIDESKIKPTPESEDANDIVPFESARAIKRYRE